MNASFIDKGVEIVNSAIEKDKEGEYKEAYELYEKALGYFISGLKYEKNEKVKEHVREKVKDYLKRAEQLKDEIANGGKKKKPVAQGGGKDGEDKETDKLRGALSDAIVKEKPNVRWDDIAGLEGAKDALREAVIMPIRFPQLFTGKRRPWTGILLYGPPGTGKSYIAKAVATEVDSTFFSVSSADLVSKWQGESEKLVRNLFQMARDAQARDNKPSVIFIDEVDSLCGARGEGENESSRRIKNEFLVQMQGVGSSQNGVLVLAATNIPWGLDPAMRRRFEKRIYIPLPDVEARVKMFGIHLGKTPTTLQPDDYRTLAQRTDGYSGADISLIVRDALMEPVRFLPEATHFKRVAGPDPKDPEKMVNNRLIPCSPSDPGAKAMTIMQLSQEDADLIMAPPITMRDFEVAVSHTRPTVGAEDMERHVQYTKEFGMDGV